MSGTAARRWRGGRSMRAGLAGLLAVIVALGGMVALRQERATGALWSLGQGADAFGPMRLGRLNGAITRDRMDLTLARAALAVEPLAWQPFYVAGQAAAARGDDRAAASLLIAARRRDPRAVVVRLALLRQAARAGDVRAAFDEVAAIASLDPPAAQVLLTRLAAGIRDPDDVDRLVDALGRHPPLYLPLLRGVVASGSSRTVELQLIARLHSVAIRDPEIAEIVIARLIAAGRYDDAYRIWSARHPGRSPRGVRDPRFDDPAATPPFGWTLAKGSAGDAERVAVGGLDLVGFGSMGDVLASQTLLLEAGHQVGRVSARGGAGDGGGESGGEGRAGFVVRLRCLADGRTLAEAPLPAGARRSEVRLDIAVPARGCAAQSLEIVIAAARGEGDAEPRLHLDRVTIDPAAAGR